MKLRLRKLIFVSVIHFLAFKVNQTGVLDITDKFTSNQAREEQKAKLSSAKAPTEAPGAPKEDDKNKVKKEAGRPEKPNDQKSEKTIKNKEAMS